MSQVIKRKVLSSYKNLLRTCCYVFAEDSFALEKAKLKVREAYLLNKTLTNEEEILAQIQVADETGEFLRQGIIQAKLDNDRNMYKLKITKDTKLHDNVPLKDVNVIDLNDYKVPEKYKEKDVQ